MSLLFCNSWVFWWICTWFRKRCFGYWWFWFFGWFFSKRDYAVENEEYIFSFLLFWFWWYEIVNTRINGGYLCINMQSNNHQFQTCKVIILISKTCKVNEIQNKHSIWHVHISKTIKVTLRNIKHALWSIKFQKNIQSDDNHFQTCEVTTFISKTYKLTHLISKHTN